MDKYEIGYKQLKKERQKKQRIKLVKEIGFVALVMLGLLAAMMASGIAPDPYLFP